MEFKVGDMVTSEKWSATGIVTEVGFCSQMDADRHSVCWAPEITVENKMGMKTLFHADSFEHVQRVWRTMSNGQHNGYFVWDILEVIGKIPDDLLKKDYYTECRDGSYISIQCFHFFSEERARESLKFKPYGEHHITIA